MKLSLKLAAFALLCAPLAIACTADATDSAGDGDDVTSDESNAAKITPGEFTLYTTPGAKPNPGCDVHTKLSLTDTSGSKAHLEETVTGMCEIAVVPNPRDYRLRDAGTDCGSRIFTGSRRKNGEKYSIKIVDNRTRLCEDLLLALITVEETTPQGTVKKYSFDGPAPSETVTVEGDLVHTVGIGGENTGASIATKSGMFELVLDAGERNQFVDGKKARVTGKKTLLDGVETHNRPAIDVESMLVCPDAGSINCMPGPNVRLSSLCALDNRSWVEKSCAGVKYLD